MKATLTIITLLLSLSGFAQDKPDSNLEFMIGKIREAYAGYGEKANPVTLEPLIRGLRQFKGTDTFASYSRLTGYFRDDHLAVFEVVTVRQTDSVAASTNRDAIRIRATRHRPANDIEGYWLDDLSHCILYLRKTNNKEYHGYVMESKDGAPAGYEVLKLTADTGGSWLADYKDMKGPYRVIVPARFPTPQVLIGRSYFKFRKIARYVPGMLAPMPEFSYDPSVVALDSGTVLLRMPYFGGYLAKTYDSMVRSNSALFSRVKTLIIDVRDNPGGTVRCFLPLFPFICTNPIREVDGIQRCSQDLIDDTRSSWRRYRNANDTARAAPLLRLIDTLERNKDSFRLEKGSIFPCDPAPNHIEHVALLVNHGSRSAAELMVLYLRQSRKVTVFGENTGGAVDYLDQITFWLSHDHFEFWLASEKRKITADQPLYDDAGIPPDVRIGDEVGDWVEYVRGYYERQRAGGH